MVVVDTNVLVYAADADSSFHDACRAWVEHRRTRPDGWYCTWPIIYELLRVTTHQRVMRHPWKLQDAWQFVKALLAAPSLGLLIPTTRHSEVAAQVVNELPHLAGNLLHDAHTAVLMREHGIRQICTRDTDFHRFPFVEVLDPVAG